MRDNRLAFYVCAPIVILCDQLGKHLVANRLAEGERAPFIGDLFGFAHVRSPGSTLGFFGNTNGDLQWIGTVLVLLACVGLTVYFQRRLAPGEQGTATALGLILGGAVSNGIDRLVRGEVVDFLYAGSVTSTRIPDFNLADLAILLGVVTLIVELLATEMATRAATASRRGKGSPPH